MELTQQNYQEVLAGLNTRLQALVGTTSEDGCLQKLIEEFEKIRLAGDKLLEDNETLRIGIVGQVKAGKSSFMNSLFFEGENVLPQASTPMTAGLTAIRYGEKNVFEVEYYNRVEWQALERQAKAYDEQVEIYRGQYPGLPDEEVARLAQIDETLKGAKELVLRWRGNSAHYIREQSFTEEVPFDTVADLQKTLERYVGADGEFTSIVKCLTISKCDERLRRLEIVDTPGVSDPIVSREIRTQEYLRTCHGVLFLSYSGRFFDSADVRFLEERIGSQGVGNIVLIASKFDSVLQDQGMKYKDRLEEALEDTVEALQSQMQRNLSASSYKGKQPEFDFSSGIGYSIAKKTSPLNNIERHVLGQMRNFYPSYFATDEEANQMMLGLSQIDDIKTKYVEGKFIAKRDEIIAEKTEQFFAQSQDGALPLAEKALNALEEYKSDFLEGRDLGDLQKQQAEIDRLINECDKSLDVIIYSIRTDINVFIKEATEVRHRLRLESMPEERRDFTIGYKYEAPGVIYGTNTKSGSEELKLYALEPLIQAFKNQLGYIWEKELAQDWKEHIKVIKQKKLMDEMLDEIERQQSQDPEGDFGVSGKLLRAELRKTIDSFTLAETVGGVQEAISKLSGDLASALQQIALPSFSSEKLRSLEGTKMELQQQASKYNKECESALEQCLLEAKTKLCELFGKECNKMFDALTELHTGFVKVVREGVAEAQERLKAELERLDETKETYDRAISTLRGIVNELK